MNRREKEIVELEKQKVSQLSVQLTMSAFVMALKHKHGFGAKRLNELLAQVSKELEGVGSGMIGAELYIEYTEEQTGIKISGENT